MIADRCSACGEGTLDERTVSLTVEHGSETRLIPDRQTVCGHCGNVSYVGKQITDHQFAVAAAIREIEGLLSAEELRRIRAKYRLRQTDMEQMLSTGEKTWTRWERGKVPQSKAADKLIRLIAEDPDVARRLMEQSGIDNPEAAATFVQFEEDARRLSRALVRAEIRQLQGDDADSITEKVAEKIFESARDIRRQAAAEASAA